MDGNDALVLVYQRNAFYQRLHYLALGALAIGISVIFFLLFAVYYLIKSPTHPVYFATDPVSRLINIIPISQPNMSQDEVMAWTIEGVEAAFSYDYVNFHGQLQAAQKYFTNYGWYNYMKAITANNNLIAIEQRKMVALAKVVAKPILITQGILGGAYAWKFVMPMLVTYLQPPYDKSAQFTNAIQVTVIVQRQKVLEGYKGLGILQIIGSEAPQETSPEQLDNTMPPT